MTEAWIIDACRTPRGIGKVGRGALTEIHPQRLGSTVLKALAERNNINTADVADIIWGCNLQRGPNGNDIGRMSALDAGYDITSSGVTLDRFFGSGITTVNMAAASIMSGMEDMVIAGGCEMMSGYGAMANEISPFVDSGNTHLREMYGQSHQGLCADTIATIEGIPREDLDRLAEVSQQRAAHAIENGYFDKSLIPVYHDDGTLALYKDEFPRPETTMETLSQLNPSFEKLTNIPLDEEGTTYGKLMAVKYPEVKVEHVHHAGNSSGVVDGAAAVLLASPEYATKQGWKPRAKVVAYGNMGDCPALMINATVPSAKRVLEKAGMTKEDIDLWEINEAFAVVAEKFIRDLDLDRDKVNVNGGAMALGHPIGATGSVLIGTMVYELERRGLKRGLVTMCAGGGMAPAIIVERI